MPDETFYLDGVDARSVGIRLQRDLEFSDPVPEIDREIVPGRNGELIFYTGSYGNREGTAECFALESDVIPKIAEINKFLLSSNGYRKLEVSYDADHYWMAVVSNGSSINQAMRKLNPFEIEFDCKPQRFRNDGNEAVSFVADGTIENPYYFDALPVVKVYGDGAGILNIGQYRVDILSLDEKGIILDSETMNAYNIDGNKNNSIKADAFPVLVGGENTVSFSGGITSVEIIPRWWEL